MNKENSKINEITKKFFIKSKFLSKLFPSLVVLSIRKSSGRRLDKLFLDISKKLSIRNFIDCGANNGAASVDAITAGLNALAIEPNPYSFKNMIVNPGDHFKKINVGLSDKEDNLKFYILKGINTATNASFKIPKNLNKYDIISVPVVPLDKLIKDSEIINHLFSLWVDVEGMEREFLKGAFETLKNNNCLLIKIEVLKIRNFNDQAWSIYEIEYFLNNLGYEAVYRDFQYSTAHNILFIKSDYVAHLSMEIDNAFKDIAKNINILNVSKFLIKYLKHKLIKIIKKIVIKILGKRLGNIIASYFGSKSSQNKLKLDIKD